MDLQYPEKGVKMFKAKQLHEQTGIETRRIQYYVDAGLVGCADNPGAGPAGRDFTNDNALELLLVDELSRGCGLSHGTIKRVFGEIRKNAPDMLLVKTYYDVDPESPWESFRVNDGLLDGYFLEIYNGGEALRIQRGECSMKNSVRIDMAEATSCIVINMASLFMNRLWGLK